MWCYCCNCDLLSPMQGLIAAAMVIPDVPMGDNESNPGTPITAMPTK